jgi:hypothetical protein
MPPLPHRPHLSLSRPEVPLQNLSGQNRRGLHGPR